MNKMQKEVLLVIGNAKESNAKTATDWAWEIAGEFYIGKRISDRRVELYVNAIMDLSELGLLSRTESDKYFGKEEG